MPRLSCSLAISFTDFLFGFGNMDDQIGSTVFKFAHQDLVAAGPAGIPFNKRWDNEGDWEIFGNIVARVIPHREDPCCKELREKLKELSKEVETLERRLAKVESSHR